MKKHYTFLRLLFAVLFSLSLSASAFCGIISNDSLYPPVNFRVDSLRALMTWDWPSVELLNEDFEDGDALPAGWTTSSAGNSGWYVTENANSLNFYIGPHSQYAATNDFNAGQQNNGCCDFLVTPAVDLTLTDSAVLTFNTCYTGAFNQAAYIELSTDNGASWQVMDTLQPAAAPYYETWGRIAIDLSQNAGPGGCASAIIRFHAADNGQQASGWAVDDVNITAYVTTLDHYCLWLNDAFLAISDSNAYQINPESLVFGQQYKVEIAAVYANGVSPHDSLMFTNRCLPYPGNLQASVNDNAVILDWDSPDFGNTGLGPWVMYYLLYCNGTLIDTLSSLDTTYWHLNLDQGMYCYKLSAVYNLEPLGYSGQTGESFAAGPACADIFYCCSLPLIEDWTCGSFDLNQWAHGDNWVIDIIYGNPYPCAKFNSVPELTDYESSLEIFTRSFSLSTGTPHLLTVQFDLALDDSLETGTEELTVFYKYNDDNWRTVASFTNQGDFQWTHYSYDFDIPQTANMLYFKVAASGEQSNAIKNWFIDNIELNIKYLLYPVYNLTATPSNANPGAISLEWNCPVDSLNLKSAAGTDDLLSYHIFRRVHTAVPGPWEDIAETTKTWYEDHSLASDCYDYYVMAYYTEGTSAISNIDSLNCIGTGVEMTESPDFRLYPNPARELLYWEAASPVKEIKIADQAGRMLYRETALTGLKGRIVTSALADGIYLICFTGNDGKQTVRKFIVSAR
ncbi:MAG TPA: choice-of-anchor J domain-containing protein [Bacteroidales bacterium]|nr:choice-of-anchor J domain-containing protein [Bacteroidales bacterium]HPT01705.1 choice-of-anchor J domain-containing protein [Bacteroidales bacterium]